MTKKTDMWGEEIPDREFDTKTTHKNYKELQFFSEERVILSMETREHPELLALLSDKDVTDFELQLAQIAAYCEVIMDGEYLPQDIAHLCTILIHKLREKRGAIHYVPAK